MYLLRQTVTACDACDCRSETLEIPFASIKNAEDAAKAMRAENQERRVSADLRIFQTLNGNVHSVASFCTWFPRVPA